MSTSRGRTAPEVALLIRRVEMDERFKVEKKDGNNKVNIIGPKGEPLILSLDADTSDRRRAERSLERMGLRSDSEPQPKTRQRVTTQPVTDPYPNITVYEKAKKVHKNTTDYAKAKQVPIGLYDGVEYYVIDEYPLKYFISKAYPRIKHYAGPGGTQEIYDFMRSTGNYARERQDDDTSAIIVRVEFSESGAPIQWRSPRGPVNDWQREQARKEAKLTAHEAGEDREPAPVVVTTVEERRRTKKKAEEVEAEKAALEAIVAAGESEAEPVTSEEMQEIQEAVQILTDAVGKVTGRIAHSLCEEREASARQEAQFQRADAQRQRERAERAEETLNCIWLAFSEMPQHKAVAEILPLLPPLKDA